MASALVFRPQNYRVVFRNVLIGCGAASFWRGAWYVLDDNLYPEQPTKSAISSLVLGTTGLLCSQGLVQRAQKHPAAVVRYGAIYVVACSCVLVWRGCWLGWDCMYENWHSTNHTWHAVKSSFLHHHVYEQMHVETNTVTGGEEGGSVSATDPGHATRSGLVSHLAACATLVAMGTFASVLAPPAAFSVIRDAALHLPSSSQSTSQHLAAAVLPKRLFPPAAANHHRFQKGAAALRLRAMSSSSISSGGGTSSVGRSSSALTNPHQYYWKRRVGGGVRNFK